MWSYVLLYGNICLAFVAEEKVANDVTVSLHMVYREQAEQTEAYLP
jgi:hypothetical protein